MHEKGLEAKHVHNFKGVPKTEDFENDLEILNRHLRDLPIEKISVKLI